MEKIIDIQLSFLYERNVVKFIIDSLSIIAGIILAFILKFSFGWQNHLKIEYNHISWKIFLVGYVYKNMSGKSWRYTNILDVLNILILNLGTAVIFTIFMYISNNYSFPDTTLVMVLFSQFLCSFLEDMLLDLRDTMEDHIRI